MLKTAAVQVFPTNLFVLSALTADAFKDQGLSRNTKLPQVQDWSFRYEIRSEPNTGHFNPEVIADKGHDVFACEEAFMHTYKFFILSLISYPEISLDIVTKLVSSPGIISLLISEKVHACLISHNGQT